MWQHTCGWQGQESELRPAIWQGIHYGYECPQCGDEWPFFNETYELREEECLEWTPGNRTKAKRAGKSKWWCAGCDRAMVGDVGKCPACGHRDNRKKIKE